MEGSSLRAGPSLRRVRPELPRIGRPYARAGDFLRAYARRMIELSRASVGEILVRRHGRVILWRAGDEVMCDWVSESSDVFRATGADAAQPWAAGGNPACAASAALMYADATLGELRLSWPEAVPSHGPDFVAGCARDLAFMVKRYDISHWAEQRLGRPLLLVGGGNAIRDLEVFVEKAAQSDLPALLHGEFGTETPHLAAAIHCCGHRRDQPFIQINCAHPDGSPDDWFRQAEGGTLFLSDVDALAPALQTQVPRRMQSRLGQWLDVSAVSKVRVIASAVADLRQMVDQRTFSRQLLAELDFLSAVVPPLRQRTDDLESLVMAALEGHGYGPEDKSSPEMLEVFRDYSWPENAFELERVVARLAVMTGRAPIRADDIRRHFPHMLQPSPIRGAAVSAAVPPSVAVVAAESNAGAVETIPEDEDEAAVAERWLRHVLAKDAKVLATLHPSLRKALVYLVDHYAEPIRLGALARQAHVSQSHLSFLFRNSLQTSCKALLARIRVEKAKAMLADRPRPQITEVALQVGFADLSHFERCFRRQVGQTPRDYRRMAAE